MGSLLLAVQSQAMYYVSLHRAAASENEDERSEVLRLFCPDRNPFGVLEAAIAIEAAAHHGTAAEVTTHAVEVPLHDCPEIQQALRCWTVLNLAGTSEAAIDLVSGSLLVPEQAGRVCQK